MNTFSVGGGGIVIVLVVVLLPQVSVDRAGIPAIAISPFFLPDTM